MATTTTTTATTPDCTSHCRSAECATNLISVITRGSTRQIKTYMERCCGNPAHVSDRYGRTALHVAASCGKWRVVDWLLAKKGAEWRSKDKESGWTALHRSLFYGQVMSAVYLIYHGASLHKHDHEDFTPLELLMKDLPPYVEYNPRNPTQTYTWGSNTNFTLGHGNQQCKGQPELLEELAKNSISVKQMAMCKFHTVVLSHQGVVYSCGHGQGGRLGLGDEQTSLVPRRVEGLPPDCVQVAVARDHTVFLMENGAVYSCGQNDYHQLGHSSLGAKCLTPKPIYNKVLRNKTLTGVAAGRFHTVVYTNEALYTFGLNAGQLGHSKGEKHVISPRQVTALQHKNVALCQVAASDASTVVATKAGDIYVLNEYQCRKMASKQINITKLVVNGGTLDAELDHNTLQKSGGEELVMAVLQKSGRVHSWRETDRILRLCQWTRRRQIFISDVAINRQGLLLATEDGESYMGYFTKRKASPSHRKESTSQSHTPSSSASSPPHSAATTSEDAFIFAGPVEKEDYDKVHLERLPSIFRATGVACDQQGRNFGVLQSDPRTSLTDIPIVSESQLEKDFGNLLSEADSTDVIHDVIIKIGNRSIATHKYILSHRSDYFRKLFSPSESVSPSEINSLQSNDEGALVVDVSDKTNEYDIFMMTLRYMYTDKCQIFTPGFKYRPSSTTPSNILKEDNNSDTTGLSRGFDSLTITDTNRSKSAYSVYQDHQKGAKKGQQGGGKKNKKKSMVKSDAVDAMLPVKLLVDAAKKLGVTTLTKRLDQVKYKDGHLQNFRPSSKKLRFERKRAPHLCDVILQSEDETLFPCHKCVLVARLEYFQSMLGAGWIETSSTEPLKLPIPGAILNIILDYIYTDTAPSIHDCQDIELLCNTLTTADQLLMTRLKEMCEGALSDLITLKNVAELLQFASVYQAGQLRRTCQQYIALNLGCLLEAKALEVLEKDVLQELTDAYREMMPAVCYRRITPYTGGPDLDDITSDEETSDNEGGVADGAQDNKDKENAASAAAATNLDQVIKKARAKRKGRRRVSSSGGKRNSVSISEEQPVTTPLVEMETRDLAGLSAARDSNITAVAGGDVVLTKDEDDGEDALGVGMETDVSAGGDAPVHASESEKDTVQEVAHPAGAWIKKGHDPKKGHGPKKGHHHRPGGHFESQPAGQQSPANRGNDMTKQLNISVTSHHHQSAADQICYQNAATSPKTWGSWQSPKLPQDPSPGDLRNIMQAQEARRIITAPTAKKPSSAATAATTTPAKSPGNKKSQKQRKREMALMLGGSGDGMASEAGFDGDRSAVEHSQPSSPWGSVAQPSTSVTSLKSLQEEEERGKPQEHGNRHSVMSTRSKSVAVPPLHAPIHFSYGVRSPPSRRTSEGDNRGAVVATSPLSPTEHHNPWQQQHVQPSLAQSPPPPAYTAPSLSFTDILKLEVEERENLNKSMKKSFSTIQIEERAIEELRKRYKVGECPGEYVTVERVGMMVAAPTWKKEKKNDM